VHKWPERTTSALLLCDGFTGVIHFDGTALIPGRAGKVLARRNAFMPLRLISCKIVGKVYIYNYCSSSYRVKSVVRFTFTLC
jgi:hypothetical protein